MKKNFIITRILGIIVILVVFTTLVVWAGNKRLNINKECNKGNQSSKNAKWAEPVIYLYPSRQQKVNVKLSYDGKLICTYPDYNNGWNVIANPDGRLINTEDNKEYSYLFWEGLSKRVKWDLSKGYVVEGKDTKTFFQTKLPELGLMPKEYNEFIVYWLPQMQNNKYNLITFQNQIYENMSKLNITPKPESILRIFMAFKSLNQPIKIEKPNIKPFQRKGFTVIEWGGTEIK